MQCAPSLRPFSVRVLLRCSVLDQFFPLYKLSGDYRVRKSRRFSGTDREKCREDNQVVPGLLPYTGGEEKRIKIARRKERRRNARTDISAFTAHTQRVPLRLSESRLGSEMYSKTGTQTGTRKVCDRGTLCVKIATIDTV